MKLLVSIANYGNRQLHCLDKLIKEYLSFKDIDVTIHVHSTVEINYPNVITYMHPENIREDLTYVHREEFINHRDDFDLYMYSENDVLITEDHIKTYLEYDKDLDNNYSLGFLRYEIHNNEKWFIDLNEHDRSAIREHINIKDKPFFRVNNDFQSCWILNKIKLNYLIDNFNFRIQNGPLKMESAATGIYKNWCNHNDGIIYKVLPKDKKELDRCLIQHISNVYQKYSHYENPENTSYKKLMKLLGLEE